MFDENEMNEMGGVDECAKSQLTKRNCSRLFIVCVACGSCRKMMEMIAGGVCGGYHQCITMIKSRCLSKKMQTGNRGERDREQRSSKMLDAHFCGHREVRRDGFSI